MRNIPFRKTFVLGGGLSLLLLLASCSGDEILNPELEGAAGITVLDANTGLPVNEVKVEVIGGSSKRSSAEGLAVFRGLRIGAYQVRLTKTGYETSQEPLAIGTTGTQEVVALNVTATYRIHRQGPTIKGRVLLHPQVGPDTSATVAARGVPVELRLTATGTGSGSTVYIVPTRTVVTDSNGYYTFAKVPEVSSYAIAVPEVSRNGKPFSWASSGIGSGTLVGSQVFTHAQITLFPVSSGSLQAFARSTTLAANQPWVFEFSAPIDTSRFASATAIQLRANLVGINSSRTWSPDFKVLSIRPAIGTWTSGASYSVVMSGVRDSTNRVLPNITTTATTIP